MAVVDGLGGVERGEYSVGDIIPILEGTGLNRGLSEDSDSITTKVPQTAVVLGRRENGAIEVSLPLTPDLRPLYFHQPEPKV